MLAERLQKIVGFTFDEPIQDWFTLTSLYAGENYPTEEQSDDLMAGLARYLRQSWSYLEDQTYSRLLSMSAACGRLLRAENGKRDPLDLRGGSEDNR